MQITKLTDNLNTALIGSTGFVGSTLQREYKFTNCYHSTDIANIDNKSFDVVICAGASAKKYLANQDPITDERNIDGLISHLKTIKAKLFVLVSTVDVFKSPIDIDENTKVDVTDLHAYGKNRYKLEQFVKENFTNHLIVRLPGLVGVGLRKNIIFDFKHNNNVEKIESRNVFQFYPMKNLFKDINIALNNNLKLVHLTAAPVSVSEVANFAFNREFTNHLDSKLVNYNFKTIYANLWNSSSDYQYSKQQSLDAIKEYAQANEGCDK